MDLGGDFGDVVGFGRWFWRCWWIWEVILAMLVDLGGDFGDFAGSGVAIFNGRLSPPEVPSRNRLSR